MIARRTDAHAKARVVWTAEARSSLAELMRFINLKPRGAVKARRAEIELAIEGLRHAPRRCEVVGLVDGLEFRRLVVHGRFFVYYIYLPPRTLSSSGTLSIRAVRHAAMSLPFFGVRDQPSIQPEPQVNA